MSALLEARGLSVQFAARGRTIHAVQDVSLAVNAGQTLAIVGESGSGKTSLGRALLRLVAPNAGSILLEGRELTGLTPRELRPLRKQMQMVFQDPHASLDPRLTVAQSIGEALAIHRLGHRREREGRVGALLTRVGLGAELASRRPHELSGGQRQRVAIARALAVEPKLLVLDEPVSALDLSIQAQILNLLVQLQRELGMAYVFISHDLRVVEHLADEVAVMYAGRIVERAPAGELFARPRHPYTRALLDSMPRLDGSSPPPMLAGEPPSPFERAVGCAFAPRCPSATERCRSERPATHALERGHEVACVLAEPAAGKAA